MKILCFVEGSYPNPETLRLPSAINIGQSLTAQGNHVVMAVGGTTTPDVKSGFVRNMREALEERFTLPCSFNVLQYPAFSKYSIAPGLAASVIPYIDHFDFILLHSLYSYPVFIGGFLAQFTHKPYGIVPHGVLAPIQRSHGRLKKGLYDFLWVKRLVSQANLIVFNHLSDQREAAGFTNLPSTAIIPLGFDPSIYEISFSRGAFRQKYLSGYQGPVILFLGRLNFKKGLDLLIEAFSQVIHRFADVRLVIVGNGDPPSYGNLVRNWIQEYQLSDKVVMVGPLYNEEKVQALQDATIFVMPSVSENFGYSLFEAMVSKLPVVVSDTVCYSTEVAEANAGIVTCRMPNNFSEAILTLLNDKAVRTQMGENGYRLAKSYSWEAFGKKLDPIIRSKLSVHEHD